MKRLFMLGGAALLMACAEQPTQPHPVAPKLPSPTVLTPAGTNLLVCFAGSTSTAEDLATPPFLDYGGTCAPSADHKKAVLANTSSDPDGDYSGVYSYDLTVYGQSLDDITELSYTYKSLNVPALPPTPGMLIYEIPIDDLGDGTFDFWAYIDAAYCGVKSGATVNIVTMAKCGIYAGSAGPYANWNAFLAAYPTAKVDNTIYWIQIISARVPPGMNNTWQISNVKFGKTGLICFDPQYISVGDAQCTVGSTFKTAILDNSAGTSGVTGVYSRETTGYGLFLSNIKDLWFKYSGPEPVFGALMYGIPIDADGNGMVDWYAVADASTCRGTPNGSGTVYTVNITRDAACTIYNQVDPPYANWAAFAAAYPNARTANDLDNVSPFAYYIVIISQRQLGDPAATWNILDAKWGAKK